MKFKERGISLIALIVTIIVLLILAGVTIASISGENGIINQSIFANNKKIASEEKEAVQWAAAQAVASEENKSGKIANKGQIADKLDEYINKKNSNSDFDYSIYGPGETYPDEEYQIISDTFIIKFGKTGNTYVVDESGSVRLDENNNVIIDRDGIMIKPASTSIDVDSTLTMEIIANTTDYKITCSDEKVVEIEKDLYGNIKIEDNTITIKGLSIGKATIVAEAENGKKGISYVTVHQDPTSIELEATTDILDISSAIKSLQIKPIIYPNNANHNTEIAWTSSDNDIAIVDSNGFVTGIKPGKVIITATTANGKSATWEVNVIATPTSIELDSENLFLDLSTNKSHQYVATIYPSTANTSIGLTWEIIEEVPDDINSEDVATISKDGVITGISNGTAVVKVTTENNKTTTGFVTIQTTPVSVNLNKTSATIDLTSGSNIEQLTASIAPTTANIKNKITWKSSNENIATVDSTGLVKGMANGTAKITVTTENGKSESCLVTVQTSPTGIALNNNQIVLDLSGTKNMKLEPTFSPSTANANTGITWSSDNSGIASVDSYGNVTAVANGSTTIRATTQNGHIAQCLVVVETSITSLSVSPTSTTLYIDETLQLIGTITPSTATEMTQWTSSNSNVANVSSSGLVTAVGPGSATITFYSSTGTKSATCSVTINAENILIYYSNDYFAKYDCNGNEIWNTSMSLQKIHYETVYPEALTLDEGVITCGKYYTIEKYAKNNKKKWSKQLAISDIKEISVVNSNDNYIVAGGNYDKVFKFDNNGNEIWSKQLAISNIEYITSIAISPDNSNIVTGGSYNHLAKISSEGNLIWEKGGGGVSDNDVSDIVISPDNSILVKFSSSRYYRSKYDSNGNKLWEKKIPGSVIIAPDNSIIEGDDGTLTKYDSNGNKVWSKSISGSLIPVKVYSNNSIMAIRKYNGHVYLSRYDSNGNEIFNKSLYIENVYVSVFKLIK